MLMGYRKTLEEDLRKIKKTLPDKQEGKVPFSIEMERLLIRHDYEIELEGHPLSMFIVYKKKEASN